LGDAALERGEWPGAQAWYARALRLTEAGDDRLRLGRIEHRLGLLARHRGDLAAAGDHLRHARECLEPLGAGHEMALVLDAQGELEAALGRPGPAAGAFREALAWVRRDEAEVATGLDVTIHLHLAELLLDAGRLLEAEEEMRRAEQLAITSNQPRALVGIYTLLGALRGRQGDETGFVFFEQAIALCRALEGPPVDEARAYHAYGLFRQSCGGPDEARAYLERAREIFRSLGVEAEVERVEAELQALSA
jgi:tetratricopeptide (TPR) repeat protein